MGRKSFQTYEAGFDGIAVVDVRDSRLKFQKKK